MTDFCLKPIGVIRTPFKEGPGTPIQASRSTAIGEIEVLPEYEPGFEKSSGLFAGPIQTIRSIRSGGGYHSGDDGDHGDDHVLLDIHEFLASKVSLPGPPL
jgi:hypothetical protein